MNLKLDGKTRKLDLANILIDGSNGCLVADVVISENFTIKKIIGAIEFDEVETYVIQEVMR